MIIKGNRHGNGAKLAAYLLDGGKHGERVAEPELYGFAAENISDAFRDLHTAANVRGIQNPLFHIQIRLPQGDQMTPEQWDVTTVRVLKTAGLEGQPYARVFHTDEKTGELHCHLGVSLIDEQTHKAKAVPFYKLRFKALARSLEQEFDLTRVRNHRDGPVKYGATKNEERQAQRLDLDKETVRNSIRQCWDKTDCGRSFEAALADQALILAQGTRRDYVVIDPKGGVHALGKRILDVPAKQIREKLADLDRENLPTVEHAREFLLALPRDRIDRLTRELADAQNELKDEIQWQEALDRAGIEQEERERRFVEPEPQKEAAAQTPTPSELFDRYINDFDAYRRDMPRLVEQFPAMASDLEKRMDAALQEQIDRAFPPLSLDDFWLNENQRPGEPERAEETRRGAQEHKERPPAPELGKTQAEIRLARGLSPGPQSFANALEDRSFILCSITADDIQRDIERLTKEWEQRRQNPQAWMEHNEGYPKLKPEFQESARRSFDAWEEQREKKRQQEHAEKGMKAPRPPDFSADIQKKLDGYVEYVQGKWAEGPKSPLERATGGLAVVTPFGSAYTLTPRNTGLTREELPEYLKGIDRKPLLSVTDAQAVMQEVREQRREEWAFDRREEWLAKQPLGRAAAEIRLAYSLTQTGPQFAAAIEDRGFALAYMTEADAERLNRWERQRLKEQRNAAAPAKDGDPKNYSFDQYAERLTGPQPAPAKEGKPPTKERDLDAFEKYRAGELVVINQYGAIFQLTAATTGAHTRDREERLNEIDRAPLLSVTAAQAAMRDYQEHRREERRQVREQEWEQKRAAQQAELDRQQIPDGPQNLKGPALHIWNACARSDSARAFAAALDEHQIALATPTKDEARRSHMNGSFAREVERFSPEYRDGEILAVTLQGQVYKLTPRNTGMTREEMEAFLQPLDRCQLHGIEATQEGQQKRLNEIHWPTVPTPEKPQQHATGLTMQEAPATSPGLHFQDAARQTAQAEAALDMPADLRGTPAEIWTAYNSRRVDREWQRENADGSKEAMRDRITVKGGRDPYRFNHTLDERGLILARATKEEAEHSQKDADHWKQHGETRPVYREGEFVVINRQGDVYSLNRRTTGHSAKEVQGFLSKADWKALPGIEAARETMKTRTGQRLADARDRAAIWDAIRMKNATRKHGRGQGRTGQPAAPDLARASGRAIGSVFGALGKLADGFSLDALTPREKYEAAKRDDRNEREADKNADYAAYTAELSERWRRDQQRQAEQKQREPERER